IAGIDRPTTVTRNTGNSPCGVTMVCWVGFGGVWENADPVRRPRTSKAAAIRWNMETSSRPDSKLSASERTDEVMLQVLDSHECVQVAKDFIVMAVVQD